MITTSSLIILALLGAIVLLLMGALIEIFRDVRQLRDIAGILDRPLHLELGKILGQRPSRFGLRPELDKTGAGLLLFLSDSCSTCRAIAASFGGQIPSELWLVVEGKDEASTREFLNLFALSREIGTGRALVDPARAFSTQLGLDTTPVALRIEDGRFVSGSTVPSTQYLKSILPTAFRLRSTDEPLAAR